jgi:outer membrane protein assembly factor BamB
VIGDPTTVLAAVGNEFGQAPALVAREVTGLVAYDPDTGTPRWAVDFPADSQAVPAVLAGGVVVVTEADGTVVGLDEADGRQLWKNAAREKCSDRLGPLSPGAVPVGPLSLSSTGQTVAVVGYGCLSTGGVEALNPMDGSTVWNWGVPEGWSLDTQMLKTVDTGSPTGEVAVVPITQALPPNASRVTAADPAPVVPTVIENRYGYAQTNDVVVLESARGQPLWDLQGVAGQAVEAVGGASNLCILTDVGADCRGASNGALRWSLYWPGKGASGTYPALECIDLPAISQGCAITSDGHLYVALATDAAPTYDNPETLPPRAGLFDLTELDLASGGQISRIPLPAYDDPDGIGVCLAGPPAVLQVTDGVALVSPQSGDVVEAFNIS